MDKQPKPVTRCTLCGKVGYNILRSKGPCGERYNGKPCLGVNQSAIGEKDWAECESCAAMGWDGNDRCHRCDGSGWLFARRLNLFS
jgi:hypothetical protein